MSRKRRSLEILGLLLLTALAAMAATPVGAQAQLEYLVKNELKERKALNEVAVEASVESKGGPFELEWTEFGFSVECEAQQSVIGAIVVEGLGKASIEFSKCGVFFEGIPLETCEVVLEPIVSSVKTTLIKIGATHYVKFAPQEGNVLAKFSILSIEEECLLFVGEKETFEVTGTLCGKPLGPGQAQYKEEQPLEFSEAIEIACGPELFVGEESAILTGKSKLDLPGWKEWGYE